jgi:hypothetical protein
MVHLNRGQDLITIDLKWDLLWVTPHNTKSKIHYK